MCPYPRDAGPPVLCQVWHSPRHVQTAHRRLATCIAESPRLFKPVATILDRGLNRYWTGRRRQSRKLAHKGNLIQRIFDARVAQAMPVMQQLSAQRHRYGVRSATIAGLAIVLLNTLFVALSGDRPRHPNQKFLPPSRLAFAAEPRIEKAHLIHSVTAVHLRCAILDDSASLSELSSEANLRTTVGSQHVRVVTRYTAAISPKS